MRDICLHGTTYTVADDEFQPIAHEQYNNLKLHSDLGELDKICGLLRDLVDMYDDDSPLLCIGWKFGGYVPLRLTKWINRVDLHLLDRSIVGDRSQRLHVNQPCCPRIVFTHKDCPDLQGMPILIEENCGSVPSHIRNMYPHIFKIKDSRFNIYISASDYPLFFQNFKYYIDPTDNTILAYDNLIHLVIMVKNAGSGFANVLRKNLPHIDRWTILDTGSTDGTIETVHNILDGQKKGKIFNEPFINFRDSRNRALDLAGDSCQYTLMLDDTYWVDGDLRGFLSEIRSDQFANSYSIIIRSDDTDYYSNRIVKTESHLRYIYTIHEVIQQEGNTNVVIPLERAKVIDERCDFMEERTSSRKENDLKLLFEMIAEEPNTSRHLYYIAQTYACLKNYEKAAEYYLKRTEAQDEGFKQEIFDSYFELARLYNFQLNRPWPICEELYIKANRVDMTRVEPFYFIGIHYYLEGDMKKAYEFLCNGFHLGHPINSQMSLRPTITYKFLPKFLVQLCYNEQNYELGIKCCERFFEKNGAEDGDYLLMQSWIGIMKTLQYIKDYNSNSQHSNRIKRDRPILCYFNEQYQDDPFIQWIDGIRDGDMFHITVFRRKTEFLQFISSNPVHTCIIAREADLVHGSTICACKNIYFIVDDRGTHGIIIPVSQLIKRVICHTKSQEGLFLKLFPQFIERTQVCDWSWPRLTI